MDDARSTPPLEPGDRVRLFYRLDDPARDTGTVIRTWGRRRDPRARVRWDSGGQSSPHARDLIKVTD